MTPTGMRLVMLIDDEPAQQRLVSALFDLDALRIKLIDAERLAVLFQEALA